MFHLFTLIFLKSIDPYFRKYIVESKINPKDYIYLETFSYSGILLFFVIYKYFNNNKDFIESYNNIKKISVYEIPLIILFFLLTLLSSFYFYKNEQKHSPFINSLFLRGGTIVGILLIGVLVHKENYNFEQIIGIILTFVGIYLIMKNKKKINKQKNKKINK